MSDLPSGTRRGDHFALDFERARAIRLVRAGPEVMRARALDLRFEPFANARWHDGEYTQPVYQEVYRS